MKAFRIGYLIIGLHFIVPALSYAIDPAAAVASVQAVNAMLGGARWIESGHLWNMLAFGNVMTLGFLCLLIRADVGRFLPALPALLFLKMCSALFSLVIGLTRDVPVFLAIFALDSVTTVVMGALALRAAHSLANDRSAPWWARWLLLDPEAIERSLARLRARRAGAGIAVPNLWQVLLGSCAMWHRVVFRSDTIGTSPAGRVRDTWRARLLAYRALRLPFLLCERAIAPLDPSGLTLPPERLIHHVLAAHHDGPAFAYDLELLALHDGALERLAAEARSVVDGTHPRAQWLRDLCVFEGYHEDIVRFVEQHGANAGAVSRDPDVTLSGYLAWCAAQPASFDAALSAWRAGRLRLRFA